jgi:hypothetical protein
MMCFGQSLSRGCSDIWNFKFFLTNQKACSSTSSEK